MLEKPLEHHGLWLHRCAKLDFWLIELIWDSQGADVLIQRAGWDDCGVFDRAVHPFDLPVGPRVVRLGEAVLDAVLGADLVEAGDAEASGPAVTVAGQVGELNAIVGQDGVHVVGNGL